MGRLIEGQPVLYQPSWVEPHLELLLDAAPTVDLDRKSGLLARPHERADRGGNLPRAGLELAGVHVTLIPLIKLRNGSLDFRPGGDL